VPGGVLIGLAWHSPGHLLARAGVSQRALGSVEATVTVVEPRSYMTYQPFLPEASAGSLSPRHVVVPLHRVLKECEVINAPVVALDHGRRVARLDPLDGPEYDLDYDIVSTAWTWPSRRRTSSVAAGC
jgi:NADH dehydrogenase FAD-containing subunit